MKLRNPLKNLNTFDRCLLLFSLCAVAVSFFAVRNTDYLTLASSLVGVTSLIFAAKGDAFGLILMLAFCIIYAVVSFFFGYYGETAIYLCMQLPTCTLSLINWLRHPGQKGSAEVKVGTWRTKHLTVLVPLAAAVTVTFYFILRAFHTENLIVSTISVTTSFIALYLMAFRIPAYAAAYMANDVVLIVMWSYACSQSVNYLPMVVCFSVFFLDDLYGFISWIRRSKRQSAEEKEENPVAEDPPRIKRDEP